MGDVHDTDSSAIRAEALEALLREKGLIDSAAVDNVIRVYEQDVGPLRGAQVVARAWTDPAFKQRLLADGTSAVGEMGFTGAEMARLEVKENTDEVHNVVVCTLCSCYPWAILGLPPSWYKQPAYRSRVVREPRQVLREMGLLIERGREIRVWDSSAEVRYLVLPQRPAGSEGLSQEELAGLVSRDAMIGVGLPKAP